MEDHESTWKIDPGTYRTPYTHLRELEHGTVRTRHRRIPQGYYPMEGLFGKIFYYVPRGGILETGMQIQDLESGVWVTWMADNPLHWLGIEDLFAKHAHGHVLCAGMGMGLMAFAAVHNPNIVSMTIVDHNEDVVHLALRLLPEDGRRVVIVAEWEEFLENSRSLEQPDVVFWDLQTTSLNIPRREMRRRAFVEKLNLNFRFPSAEVWQWGYAETLPNFDHSQELAKYLDIVRRDELREVDREEEDAEQ